LNAMTRLISR